ncbi:MAG: hypothetical protein KJN90_15155 [Gammaproteobacteria bacterium]|nr:hypothetical protein [Gammaproteobacteria bacterium]
MGKLVTWLGLLGGILLSVTGAGFVILYVTEGIIARMGEPDQSLLFWYLPILFIGIFALMFGLALVRWAWTRMNNS